MFLPDLRTIKKKKEQKTHKPPNRNKISWERQWRAMPVLLEDNACPLKAVAGGLSPPPAQMPPYETFPDTEAKLDPIYAPDLRSGAENTLPAEEGVLA